MCVFVGRFRLWAMSRSSALTGHRCIVERCGQLGSSTGIVGPKNPLVARESAGPLGHLCVETSCHPSTPLGTCVGAPLRADRISARFMVGVHCGRGICGVNRTAGRTSRRSHGQEVRGACVACTLGPCGRDGTYTRSTPRSIPMGSNGQAACEETDDAVQEPSRTRPRSRQRCISFGWRRNVSHWESMGGSRAHEGARPGGTRRSFGDCGETSTQR